MTLVGKGNVRLVRRNEVGDWSLLTPLAYVSEDNHDVERGSLVIPLRLYGPAVSAFVPSCEKEQRPLYDKPEG